MFGCYVLGDVMFNDSVCVVEFNNVIKSGSCVTNVSSHSSVVGLMGTCVKQYDR